MFNNENHDNEKIQTASTESTASTNGQTPAPEAPVQNAQNSGYAGYPYTAQTSSQYNSQYKPYQAPQYQQPQQTSYSWGPAQANPQTPYYNAQPPKPKKKRHPGKAAAKVVAGVLACAVVSLGSVGVFAAMIQNGVVDVRSPEGDKGTAAITLYTRSEDTKATPTATIDGMSTQEVAQRLIPSVVCVQNYKVRESQSMNDPFSYFFYGGQGGQVQEDGGEISPAGEGSGIILSEDGYIVTNQHVIDGATNISVVTSDGATYDAKLIGEDTQTDLAVIKIDTTDTLTPAKFGNSDDLQVTDQVLAIGNPGGMQFNSSVTIGYVSALNRAVTNSETGFVVNCIQTDAAINPGNSGGALVDTNGLVVGINSSKIAATAYEGIGFAIPSSVVQPVVSNLIEYGYVKDRPMLGITGLYLDRTRASYFGFSQGFCVGKLTGTSESSGLQIYDVITAIDDVQITSENTIASYIANKKPGDKVTLTVDRALTGETGLKIEVALIENTGSSD